MKKKSVGIVTIMVLAQVALMLVVFLFVYIFMNSAMSSNIRSSVIESMETIVQERSQIIENYVTEAENYLTAYSRAGEITDLLLHPTDADAVAKAQTYTEVFSGDRENLEGNYASEWNTHVLAHTNAAVVGITTREGDPLKALQDAMMATDGVYNTGIIISPASGAQIISMYKACYDADGNPIGLVGGGIFTTGLIEMLESLPSGGMDQLQYCMVNVNTGEYIFNSNPELIATVAEEPYITDIVNTVKNGASDTAVMNYEDGGTDYLACYNYMADRGWVFVITDPAAECGSCCR